MRKPSKKMPVVKRSRAAQRVGRVAPKSLISLTTTAWPAPPPKIAPRAIAGLRLRLRMSQTVFAAMLGTSRKTVQTWEQGTRAPNTAALRFLQIIGERPDVVELIFRFPGASVRKGVQAVTREVDGLCIAKTTAKRGGR